MMRRLDALWFWLVVLAYVAVLRCGRGCLRRERWRRFRRHVAAQRPELN